MNDAKEPTQRRQLLPLFDATQLAFVALVKKGILSKTEAEAILRKAIEAVKTEGAGEQAAELLAGILERLSNFQPAPRK